MPPYIRSVRALTLGQLLKDKRKESGLSQDAVASRLNWSQGRVSHLETARTKPARADVVLLLRLYGVTDKDSAYALDLLDQIDLRDWWTEHIDVVSGPYVALEDAAAEIYDWCPQVLPGLLQTVDYMRALLVIGDSEPPDLARQVEIDKRIEVRRRRQQRLTRRTGPLLHVIIDQAILERPIGGRQVMRDQILSLIAESRRPNIVIQVLEKERGEHPGLDGPLIVLKFAEAGYPNVIYTEGMAGGNILEGPHEVEHCNFRMERLRKLAATPDASRMLLEQAAAAYAEPD